MRAFSKFRALVPAERRVVIAALLLLPVFSAALRLAGGNRLPSALASGLAQRSGGVPLEPERTAMLVGAVAGRLPLRPTCLVRSLFLQWLLQRQGLRGHLKVGVRFSRGVLEAHAWVECDGRPVNELPAVCAQYHAFSEPLPMGALFRR